MSLVLTAIVTGIYLLVAVSEVYQGRTGFALMFFGYALANVGIMLSLNV